MRDEESNFCPSKHNPNGIGLALDAEVVEGGRQKAEGRRQNTHSSWLRRTVQDDGVGIPLEQCDRLFERYARGARAGYMPGLGLGLYLCRQIVQANGGQIGVMSTQARGRRFGLLCRSWLKY